MRARGGGSGVHVSEGVNASERVAPPPCPPVHVIVFTRLPRAPQSMSLPSHASRSLDYISLSSQASPVPSCASHCLQQPESVSSACLVVFTRLPLTLVLPRCLHTPPPCPRAHLVVFNSLRLCLPLCLSLSLWVHVFSCAGTRECERECACICTWSGAPLLTLADKAGKH